MRLQKILAALSASDDDNVEIHYIQSGDTARVKISELLKR